MVPQMGGLEEDVARAQYFCLRTCWVHYFEQKWVPFDERRGRDYIAFVLTETDLRVHACDYGWCVFQPETARCGGIAAPSEVARSPSTCLGCVNFIVDERHRGYWQDRREPNEALLDTASAPTRAVLDKAIGECNRVLALIGEEDNER